MERSQAVEDVAEDETARGGVTLGGTETAEIPTEDTDAQISPRALGKSGRADDARSRQERAPRGSGCLQNPASGNAANQPIRHHALAIVHCSSPGAIRSLIAPS